MRILTVQCICLFRSQETLDQPQVQRHRVGGEILLAGLHLLPGGAHRHGRVGPGLAAGLRRDGAKRFGGQTYQ